ncbi:hypothetical protein BJ138DRAFT_824538 [Hygrophoropsis aurantiaca]|uniref:Uncharacterized protein n=1 Tax=Hygrophoropsis aurantiaca TaxID=72124 RepID=A0ACB8AT09_9AGAM|nr:hypothetical protein BJ138DRAFT_824538 [Hygrophoropsis aurantiaca]
MPHDRDALVCDSVSSPCPSFSDLPFTQWESGYDESVEVNQRALIDKVLARYSGEFTVFRELLQNSDDAQSTAVEIRFETEQYLRMKGGQDAPGINEQATDTFPDLKATHVAQWTFRNNGIAFRDEDWSRLRKIAEGNPDEEKIGAFGVGFYSLFSVTEEPFVTSGGHGMQFYWKDKKDQLNVRRGDLPPKDTIDPWTSFEMTLRETAPIPQAFDFTRFLASSITFMTFLNEISVFFDDRRLARLTKSTGATNDLGLLKGLKSSSGLGMMNVKGVKSAPIRIKAEVVQAVYSLGTEKPAVIIVAKPTKPAASQGGGFFSSLFSSFAGNATPQRTITPLPPPPAEKKDPMEVFQSSVTLTVFSADVEVRLDRKMIAELHRSTKKNPPQQLSYSLIYTGKDEYDNSVLEEKKQPLSSGSVFQGLRADLNGSGSARVFIGHATGQTTGIGGHMASRFIPTVERESIDLVDRNVAVWNRELLYVGGFLARTAYELELANIRTLWEGAAKSSAASDFQPGEELKDWLRGRFTHVLKFFTFHTSTPSAEVSRFLEAAFFSCATQHPFSVLSTAGVQDAVSVRAPDPLFALFLKQLPVLPEAVFSEVPLMVASLQSKGMIKDITFLDVLSELRARPLNEEELVACLKWWTGLTQQGSNLQLPTIRAELLSAAVLTFGTPGSEAKVLPLASVQYFINLKHMGSLIPLDGPLPNSLMPLSITRQFETEQLFSFKWREFSVVDWIQHISSPTVLAGDVQYCLPKSAAWAERVLAVLTRAWPSLSAEAKNSITATLSALTCIPTSAGLKLPGESYFASADIFNDLPVVSFSSGPIKVATEKVLTSLGVRKHVELQLIFDRMVKTGDWTISDLTAYLVSVQSTLTPEEFTRLQSTSAFPKENGTGDPSVKKIRHRACELYEPNNTLRSMGLPIIDWGEKTKWKSTSEETKFLYRLGLRRSPPLDVLLNLCASSDANIRTVAFKYLTDNLSTRYPEYVPEKVTDIPFIPALDGSMACMGTMKEVFGDAEWASLGFLVVQPDFRDVAIKLGLKNHPPAFMLVVLLEKNPPKDEAAAKKCFEILAGHITDFTPSQLSILSKMAFVPSKGSETEKSTSLRWLPPNQCYLGGSSKGQFHSKLFIFIDFGSTANRFLSACGSKQEPSVEEVAGILMADPRRFYELAGGRENFLIELRNLAVNHRMMSSHTFARLKNSPVLLGTRRQRTSKGNSRKSLEWEEDDWELQYDLRKPHEIIIADDTNGYQVFGDSIFAAPQEDLLEDFYAMLGSKRLSTAIREDYKTTSEVKNSKTAVDTRTLLLERLPLFLHEHTHARTRVSLTWLANENNFKVKTFGKLTVVKSLEFGEVNLTRSQDASAAAKRLRNNGPIELWLAGNGQVDMYEVATSLCRFLFESVKVNDALLFMTILSTDLRALKRRGYNIDKILRQQQHDRQIAEDARKREAEHTALIRAPSPSTGVASRVGNLLHRPKSPTRSAIPGDWVNEDDTPVASPSMPRSSSPTQVDHTLHDVPIVPPPRPPSAMVNSLQTWKRKLTGHGNHPSPTSGPIDTSATGAGQRSGANDTRSPIVTPLSNIRSNVAMAINACKPEQGNLIHNRREMQMIKESLNDGYCDISGHVGELELVGQMGTVKMFCTRDVPERNAILTRKRDSLARFIHIITRLSDVYNLPLAALHVFYDLGGGLIAFNKNGSIFLNLRYFESWHDADVQRGDVSQAFISWYFTLAHEIAHNLIQPHNSEHEFYFSALCETHIISFSRLLAGTVPGSPRSS